MPGTDGTNIKESYGFILKGISHAFTGIQSYIATSSDMVHSGKCFGCYVGPGGHLIDGIFRQGNRRIGIQQKFFFQSFKEFINESLFDKLAFYPLIGPKAAHIKNEPGTIELLKYKSQNRSDIASAMNNFYLVFFDRKQQVKKTNS